MGVGISPGPGGGGGTQHDFKSSCRLATAAAMAASTRTGNVRVANANGVMADVDGVTPAIGNSILDKDNATGADRGIWVVDSVGVADPGGSPWQMTRRFDASAQGDLSDGAMVPIAEGTLAGHVFALTTDDPIEINVTSQTWTDLGLLAPLVTAALRGLVNDLGAANTVLTTDGATAGGAWSRIVDANVNAAAAIAGTKIAPDFGAQDVVTTGRLTAGSTSRLIEGAGYATLRPDAIVYPNAGDGQRVTNGAITATDATLTSASNPFVAGDVGKAIRVTGAGVAGADLLTTIASYTGPGEVELAAVASTTVLGTALTVWGTDHGGTAGLFATAWAAAAGTGRPLTMLAGVYVFASPSFTTASRMASNLTLVGAPGVVLASLMPYTGGLANVFFTDKYAAAAGDTTLDSTPTVGAVTVSTVATVAAATIIRIVGAALATHAAYYTVRSVAGAGPFTLTLDRPVLKTFAAGDAVQVITSQPHDIHIQGNGMVWSGTGDAFYDLFGAVRCSVTGVVIHADWGALSDGSIGICFDIGSRECVATDCSVDLGATGGWGIYLSAAERVLVRACTVRRCTHTAIAMMECEACEVVDSHGWQSNLGAGMQAEGGTFGCGTCRIVGGSFVGNSSTGITVSHGSHSCDVDGAACKHNTSYGLSILATGAAPDKITVRGCACTSNGNGMGVGGGTRLKVVDSDISGNTAHGIDIAGAIDLRGITAWGGNPTGIVVATGGAYDLYLSNFEFQGTALNQPYLSFGASVRAHVQNGHIQIDTNASNNACAVGNGGVVTIRDVTIDGSAAAGSAGWNGGAGGTLRMDATFKNGASWWFAGGSYCNLGTVVANGVTAVDVAFPDIKTTIYAGVGDHVDLVRLTDGGTPGNTPRVTVTNATKFTINADLLDTSTYAYAIR